MRIIIDIGHPAHVHLFKNLAWQMQTKGYTVLFTCRDREHVVHLLQTYQFKYENYGKHYKSMKGKLLGLVKNELQLLATAIRFKPDMFLSHGSTIAAFASFILRVPHIAWEDTYNMEQLKLSMPFTDVVLTGDYEHPSLGAKEIRYPGFHELAYLHPNVFTPDASVLQSMGLEQGEKFAIVRFVAWAATHDVGHEGITHEHKKKLVFSLAKQMKVFITSENELPDDLKQYQIKIKPEDMHSVLAYAHFIIGESATMASECACLGVPAIYMDKVGRKYTDLQEKKYGLVYNYSESLQDQNKAIEKALELANMDNLQVYKDRKDMMLKDMIDVTAFCVWFVESYPASLAFMRKKTFNFDKFH